MGSSQTAASGPQVRTVGVVTVAQQPVERKISQPATLQGLEEATLYAKTAGYLKAVYVDKGDRVKAGQLLAVIESPELSHQRDQARAGYNQSRANAQGVVAGRGRARADVAQSAAAVEGKKSDVQQAEAVIARAKADLARAEAQPAKLQASASAAEAEVQQAQEAQAEAQTEIERFQQQVKTAQATQRAAEAGLEKARADSRLQEATYRRYKAVQDKDRGLIAGQQVDEAKARMDAAGSEVQAQISRVEAARESVRAAQQQVEGARRAAAAAAGKVKAAQDRAQAAKEDLKLSAQDIETARQQVKVAEAQRDAARSQVTVAERQRDALKQQLRVAEAQVLSSQMQTEGSRSALGTAADLAGYTRITAPFDGVVTERLSDPGAMVQNAGGSAGARGIVKVVRDASMRVLIPVPEAEIPHIRVGGPASVTLDAYPDSPFPGTVRRFASAVDPKTRTMLTEIVLANPQDKLRPGMYARATLTLETHATALTVPSEAVMGKDDRFVYAVIDGKAQKTPVTVGVDDGKTAEITDGLKPGAVVVVSGRDAVVNGAPVKTEPFNPEKSGK
jgi:RND family efflux transporter MFP subunit